MRWLGLVLAPLFWVTVAGAEPQVPSAGEEDGDWEVGGEEAAPAEPESTEAAPTPAPRPAPTVVVTSPPEPPKVVLQPGRQVQVEPRCGARAGEPITIQCASAREAAAAEQPEPRRIWYGWETLVADLGIMSMFAVTTKDTKRPPMEVYLGAAALSAPIIHFTNRNPGRGGISLGIRGGALAALLLAAENDGRLNDEALAVVTVLYLLGVHIPMTAIDAAVLGRKYVPAPPPQTAFKPKLVGVAPMIGRSERAGVRSETYGAAFAGTF